ncbi:unnamed protein product [Rotaria socialis]|uniref:Katanin p80 subunit C-terminal domain-containing protein n=1 Tax=Rotaria socialis TaxID=392032 RepID=A0A820STK0_9BILA|nr:unnamed protein product [Rotaria socialis]
MKIAAKSLLTLLDVGTGFCYWLLGRDLLEEEIQCIQNLFNKVKRSEDEVVLQHELNNLTPGKDLLLVCNAQNYNLVQWCILNNYTQALTTLLEYGCNPSRTGLSGYDLPLALACCLNRINMIKLLLDYGANPSETTELSSATLKYLAQENNKEYYSKLIDLIKNRITVTALNIVLKFDNLEMFGLLIRDIVLSPSRYSEDTTQRIDHANLKISDNEFEMVCDKLKIENYVEKIIASDNEECTEQQQQIATNDDLSDYVEYKPLFSFCDTLDVDSIVVNNYDDRQVLSEKCEPLEQVNIEETFVPVATTDGGYFTVDGSSGNVKLQPLMKTVDQEMCIDENLQNLCIAETEQFTHSSKQNELIPRTKSQQQLNKLSSNNYTMHRRSLPNNVFHSSMDQPSKRCLSTSSFLLSNIPNSTKQTAHLLRLLHQMIEHEAADILEYFLRVHRNEFNDHFHAAISSSDIELKTYELLSNIKSDKIYNVLLSSDCTYFNRVTTSLCDRENNTLVHSLLGQNPLKYQPTEMIKMVEFYMEYGLKEFINRPNLSNHCMIQILLCNEHFLKMLFFPRSSQSSLKNLNLNIETMTTSLPIYDRVVVEKWRQSYLVLIETLIKHGARIDISSGSYRNSLDCLLSTLIDLAKRLTSIAATIFDIKYLKRLIIILLSSLNQTKNRIIYFKYNIERFLQLICFIHINNDDLSEILSIIHVLLQYECQTLRLNRNTLMHLFKLWITKPNFLCSSLIGKDLFMQQLLTIIIRRFNLSTQINNQSNDNLLLLLSTTTNLSRRSSITQNENDVTLQNLLFIILNLLSIAQTCLQIQSIYELVLIFIIHTKYDIINNSDEIQLPIVYLCLQIKMTHACEKIPDIQAEQKHSIMSISGSDVKRSSFPVGESGTNVTTVTFGHRSGKLLATGSDDNAIHIYVIGQPTSLLTSRCQTTAISALRFSNEENLLASGSRSGAVKICDLESQKVMHPGGHKTCIRSIEYFPSSNNFLATGAVDGTAKLWDPRRKGFIFHYTGHNGAINALKFSPDGRFLVTASDDTAIQMWDVTAGKIIKAFQQHQGPVFTIEYHPRELLLASGGADRRTKFWDLEKLQFIGETELETSAIKCLAFEPSSANYLLTGSNDTLRVYNWEPVQLLDSVPMGWKNVVDMTIHRDQLFGASVSQNEVCIGTINLSSLKTKRRISPVRDYFPSDLKAPSIATSTMSGRRSHYQPMAVKDEHVKLKPEPTSASNIDDSKTSVADSVMIDNQADYERIFRGKARLPRSPSHQGGSTVSSSISSGVPETQSSKSEVSSEPSFSYTTSTGFSKSPSTNEVSSVPAPTTAKPKTSQSTSSPPPQIDRPMHPARMPNPPVVPTEQPRTNEQIFASLSKANQTINTVQQQRRSNLSLLIDLSRSNTTQITFQAIINTRDLSLGCFLLRFVLEKLAKRDWNLELCTLILPAIRDLIKSHYYVYNMTACQALERILTNFGKLIYDNVGAKSIGVDLSQQARRDKCQTCHHVLHEIRCVFEDRLKNISDFPSRQLFDDNLRLLNALERP